MSRTIEKLAVEAGFSAERDPLGQNQFLRNTVAVGSSLKLRTDFDIFSDIALSARYRGSSNKFTSQTVLPSEFLTEKAF